MTNDRPFSTLSMASFIFFTKRLTSIIPHGYSGREQDQQYLKTTKQFGVGCTHNRGQRMMTATGNVWTVVK